MRRGLRRDPSSTTWEVAALLGRHYGTDDGRLERVADATRGQSVSDPSAPPSLIYDIATFRAYPADGLVTGAGRLIPDQPWPWLIEPAAGPSRRLNAPGQSDRGSRRISASVGRHAARAG